MLLEGLRCCCVESILSLLKDGEDLRETKSAFCANEGKVKDMYLRMPQCHPKWERHCIYKVTSLVAGCLVLGYFSGIFCLTWHTNILISRAPVHGATFCGSGDRIENSEFHFKCRAALVAIFGQSFCGGHPGCQPLPEIRK